MKLKGKYVFVIGGSSGIGKEVALLCAAQEAIVTLTSREAARAQAAASDISSEVSGLALDINNEKAVIDFFASVAAVDHIYIAAGATQLGSLTEGKLADSMKAFDTRLLGSLRIVRAVVDKMNPEGSITFTGGVSTDRPIAGAWVSGLATASAEQLARVLVMEYPDVRFNAVAPGYTDTPMWDTILGSDKESVLSEVAKSLPVKKIASAEEVASAVVFLMSNASVTGETIHIDGGGRLV